MKTDKLNEKFKKATKAQKRVMIAQDVLAQIKTKRYIVESGCWIDTNINAACEKNLKDEDSVQELFAEKKIESCNVCALGGLFMSCTNFNNNTSFVELNDASGHLGDWISEGEEFSNKLNKIFSYKQLRSIESYFENNEGYFYNQREFDGIKAFCNAYPSEKKRLKLIMENIVENNGTFVPEKLKI